MQTEELSYATITPYSMRKSRTGGIIARLISRTGLDLVAARMFAPSEELVRRYEFYWRKARTASTRLVFDFSRCRCCRKNAQHRRSHLSRRYER